MKIKIVAYERIRYVQTIDIPKDDPSYDAIRAMLESGNDEGAAGLCVDFIDTSNIDDWMGFEDVEVTLLEGA